MTIDILPDDVLVLIFYFDGPEVFRQGRGYYPSWHRLVHVCQRWRSLVFASPKYLDLRLVFDPWAHMELAGIWPPLPIIIRNIRKPFPEIDAAIVHRSRVREIDLYLPVFRRSPMERLISAMREPFPALIRLRLKFPSYVYMPTVLPDGFLGGSAPHLRSLELHSIVFTALPKFLLSATDLVDLTLRDIPEPGYISSETLLTCLAVLTNLKSLTIEFQPPPEPEVQHPLSPTRTILPALTYFELFCISEYLEYLMAHIDAPLLDTLRIALSYEDIFDICDISQLCQFMRRTARFQALKEAHVDFDYEGILVTSYPPTQTVDEEPGFRISGRFLIWGPSIMAEALTPLFPPIHIVEDLYIYGNENLLSEWEDPIENVEWLQIFRSFTAVKNLYLRKEIARCIALPLQGLGVRVADVLPALECLFLEDLEMLGPAEEAIGQFVTARRLSGRPVALSSWNKT